MKNIIFCLVLFLFTSCEVSDIERAPDDQLMSETWTWFDPNSAPGQAIYSVLEFYPDGTVYISYKINKTEPLTEVGWFEYLKYKDGYLVFQKTGMADTYAQKSQLKDGKLFFGGRIYELETQ